MARLLLHLFEVTERFGMETRTELILLQRTMVVTEGVARTLDPKMNMWEAAKPVVEDYIRTNLGPRAVVRDLTELSRTLTRVGPRLIQLIESAAENKSVKPETPAPTVNWTAIVALLLSVILVLALFAFN